MEEREIKISQSLIKALRFDELDEPQVCPKLVKLQYIDGMFDSPSTVMQYGNYFETQILGSNKDGSRTDDLPRTFKRGEKTTDHQRIDDMVDEFKNVVIPEYMLDVESHPHIELEAQLPGIPYPIVGHLDLVSDIMDPTIDPDNKIGPVIIDLKITADLGATYGPFPWGAPYRMDHLQAKFYQYLWEEQYGEPTYFYYFVAEYGPKRNWKVFRRDRKPLDKQEVKEAIRKTSSYLDEWLKTSDFPIKPNYEDCSRCPLGGSCPGYRIGRSVEII